MIVSSSIVFSFSVHMIISRLLTESYSVFSLYFIPTIKTIMGNNLLTKKKYEVRRRSLEEIINHSHCYKDLEFAWHHNRKGRTVRFLADRVKAYGLWGLALPSQLILSQDIMIEYQFEITMMNNSHGPHSSFMMGFIYYSLTLNQCHNIDFDNNLINIDDDKQFVIQIGYGNNGLIKFYGPNKVLKDSIKLPYSFKDNDKFKMVINFKQRYVELYYNDKYIGIIFNQIPLNTKLIPCIALKNAQLQLSNSRMKCI